MKKLTACFIASCFLLVGAGAAWADDPVVHPLDRHAVWTKGKTQGAQSKAREMKPGMTGQDAPRSVSTGDGMERGTPPAEPRFDFVEETKTYDHAQDSGDSA